jgi:23S rRNA (cytidine1920-2'-O)/16S rRNA (cytidine1409-2'-O)-methyltransferase
VKDHPTRTKKRLDLLLVERGLAETRQRAQAVILAGKVRADGQRQDKAGAMVAFDASIEVTGDDLRYASRGGRKLEGALEEFAIDPTGKICLDVGSSTGGFTDCLLQHGAARVYAVDVTITQLAWKLQRDPRVVQLKANARYLAPSLDGNEGCTERPSLVTVDLSFISVTKVLPRLVLLAAPDADFLILVKPQFELERKEVGRGGIVREAPLHERAIESVRAAAADVGLVGIDVAPSRLTGAEGNQEFFLRARLARGADSDPLPRALG